MADLRNTIIAFACICHLKVRNILYCHILFSVSLVTGPFHFMTGTIWLMLVILTGSAKKLYPGLHTPHVTH